MLCSMKPEVKKDSKMQQKLFAFDASCDKSSEKGPTTARDMINRCEDNENTQRGIHVSWNVLCSAVKRNIVEAFLYIHPCVIFQMRLP